MNKELLPVTLKPDEHGIYIYGVMPDGSENMVMDLSFEMRIRGWGGLTGNGGGRGLDHNTAAAIQKMWQKEICNRYNSYIPRSEYDKLKQQADKLCEYFDEIISYCDGNNEQHRVFYFTARDALAEYRKETE